MTELPRAAAALKAVAEGYSLHEISRMPGKPTLGQMRRWLRDRPAFREDYRVARSIHAERLDCEMRRMADGLRANCSLADIERMRLRIEVHAKSLARVERDIAQVKSAEAAAKRPADRAEIVLRPMKLSYV